MGEIGVTETQEGKLTVEEILEGLREPSPPPGEKPPGAPGAPGGPAPGPEGGVTGGPGAQPGDELEFPPEAVQAFFEAFSPEDFGDMYEVFLEALATPFRREVNIPDEKKLKRGKMLRGLAKKWIAWIMKFHIEYAFLILAIVMDWKKHTVPVKKEA